jgi:hypothetical protein
VWAAGNQNPTVKTYNSIVVEKVAIFKDCKRTESFRVI